MEVEPEINPKIDLTQIFNPEKIHSGKQTNLLKV